MKAACWARRHWLVPILVAVSVLVIGVAWNWGTTQAEKREAYRTALQAQNDRIIDCTTPGRQCFEDSQKRSVQTLGRAFVEIDCVVRRAIAELPAIDPTKGPCAAQTPPSVYPGAP